MIDYLDKQYMNAAENATPTHGTEELRLFDTNVLWIIIFHHLYSFLIYITGK
jgi:hypothetical protein